LLYDIVVKRASVHPWTTCRASRGSVAGWLDEISSIASSGDQIRGIRYRALTRLGATADYRPEAADAMGFEKFEKLCESHRDRRNWATHDRKADALRLARLWRLAVPR
jgi:hypothetical protein